MNQPFMEGLRGASLLITGGAGFIGSNFVVRALEAGAGRVVVLDALTYAGSLDNLASVEADPRFRFVPGSIADRALVGQVLDGVDLVVNFAAETHVDRSLSDPTPFLDTNVMGTFHFLEALRSQSERRNLLFLHVSTDEVYGTIDAGVFTEASPSRPRSPYAASKAAADGLVLAWYASWGVPALITRGSNTYGPRQFPEKLIPVLIRTGLRGERLPIYGDGQHVRDWLHVDDHNDGIARVLTHGEPGGIYNLGGGEERTNLQVAGAICAHLDRVDPRPEPHHTRITSVADRLGHDRRYAVDSARAHSLGWRPMRTFDEGLVATIEWYRENAGWRERAAT